MKENKFNKEKEGKVFSIEMGNLLFEIGIDYFKTLQTTTTPPYFYYEMIFSFDNSSEVIFLDEKYNLHNHFLIVPPKVVHKMEFNLKKVVAFSFKIISQDQEVVKDFLKNNKLDKKNVIYVIKLNSKIKVFCYEIGRIISEGGKFAEKKITALLTLLFLEIFHFNKSDKLPIVNYASSDNERYIQFLIDKYYLKNDFNLEFIAKKIFLSEKHTSRILRKFFNCSLSQLINEKKLYTAQQLLINTDLTVKQVAKKVNYKTEGYFFACFKKKYGCTPVQYKEQYFKSNNIQKNKIIELPSLQDKGKKISSGCKA